MARRQKNLTLEEALQVFEELGSDDIEDIYIEPPDAAEITDEDSADEDEGGLADNLSGNQLRAKVEIKKKVQRNCGDIDISDSEEEINPPKTDGQPSAKRQRKYKGTNSSNKRKWIDENIKNFNAFFPQADYSDFRSKSPLEMFELFFDDGIISLLTSEITKYALFTNNADPQVTPEEIKVFIGILILSGYCVVPGKRRFWENATDLRNELVYNAMRRERFSQIMRFMHVADNTKIDKTDKVYKLRPLINNLNEKFLSHFKHEQNINYDESMIKYFGRHSCKQFIRGKPIRFGYKAWCLNTPEGYLINFDIYQGKGPNSNSRYEEEFGKASAPLVRMLDKFPDDIKNLPFCLYVDNLFLGMNLISELKKRGYRATGTIRENRIPADCSLPSCKEMKKWKRGSYEIRSCLEENIAVVRWVDNAVVTVASNCHGINPITNVRRFSRAEKKEIQVPRPNLIGKYNCFMGGTDRMDENVYLYRIAIRGKKWWWSIFTWLIDVMVHNAWILYRKSNSSAKQLEFRRFIVQTYLSRYSNPPKAAGRNPISCGSSSGVRVSDELRFDKMNHLVRATSQRRHCAAVDCKSRTRTECAKCNVGLCVGCFITFHTKM